MNNIDIEVFHKNCGEILRLGLSLDGTLSNFLANYFSSAKTNNRNFILEDFFIDITFGKKIELFKEICDREINDFGNKNLIQGEIDNIKNALGIVNSARNKVAHHFAMINHEGVLSLNTGKSVTSIKQDTLVDEVLVKKVGINTQIAQKGLNNMLIILNIGQN